MKRSKFLIALICPFLLTGCFKLEDAKPQDDQPSGENEEHEHSHSYGDWLTDIGADTHSKTCGCGDKITEPHEWGEGEITLEPTTESEGLRTFTCENCGATKTEEIEKLVIEHTHDFSQKIEDETTLVKEATCTEPGVYYYSCECGEIGTATFETVPNGHNNADKVNLRSQVFPYDCYLFKCPDCGEFIMECEGHEIRKIDYGYFIYEVGTPIVQGKLRYADFVQTDYIPVNGVYFHVDFFNKAAEPQLTFVTKNAEDIILGQPSNDIEFEAYLYGDEENHIKAIFDVDENFKLKDYTVYLVRNNEEYYGLERELLENGNTETENIYLYDIEAGSLYIVMTYELEKIDSGYKETYTYQSDDYCDSYISYMDENKREISRTKINSYSSYYYEYTYSEDGLTTTEKRYKIVGEEKILNEIKVSTYNQKGELVEYEDIYYYESGTISHTKSINEYNEFGYIMKTTIYNCDSNQNYIENIYEYSCAGHIRTETQTRYNNSGNVAAKYRNSFYFEGNATYSEFRYYGYYLRIHESYNLTTNEYEYEFRCYYDPSNNYEYKTEMYYKKFGIFATQHNSEIVGDNCGYVPSDNATTYYSDDLIIIDFIDSYWRCEYNKDTKLWKIKTYTIINNEWLFSGEKEGGYLIQVSDDEYKIEIYGGYSYDSTTDTYGYRYGSGFVGTYKLIENQFVPLTEEWTSKKIVYKYDDETYKTGVYESYTKSDGDFILVDRYKFVADDEFNITLYLYFEGDLIPYVKATHEGKTYIYDFTNKEYVDESLMTFINPLYLTNYYLNEELEEDEISHLAIKCIYEYTDSTVSTDVFYYMNGEWIEIEKGLASYGDGNSLTLERIGINNGWEKQFRMNESNHCFEVFDEKVGEYVPYLKINPNGYSLYNSITEEYELCFVKNNGTWYDARNAGGDPANYKEIDENEIYEDEIFTLLKDNGFEMTNGELNINSDIGLMLIMQGIMNFHSSNKPAEN